MPTLPRRRRLNVLQAPVTSLSHLPATPLGAVGVDKRGLLVRGRVTFLSIGGKNPKGNVTRRLDLDDGSTAEPMSLTLVGNCVHLLDKVNFQDAIAVRNVRSGSYQDKTSLLGTDGDNVSLTVEPHMMDKDLPSLNVHPVSVLAELPTDPVNLLATVVEWSEENVTVRDHEHPERTVTFKLMNETRVFPFVKDATYIFHNVRPTTTGVTLWPSAGVERVSEAVLAAEEEEYGEVTQKGKDVTQLDPTQLVALEDL